MLRTRLIGTVAAAAVLSVLAPGAAHAGRALYADPANDVWERPDQAAPLDAFVNVDLNVTDVRHTRKAIVTTVAYYELEKTADDFYVNLFLRAFRGGEERGYRTDLYAGPGRRGGEYTLFGDGTPCAGMKHAVDYDANTLTMRLPRSCIGNPRAVRFDLDAVTEYRTSETNGFYFDDALTEDFPELGYSERITRPAARG